MRKCWVIPPRYKEMVGPREDGFIPECIRLDAHYGPHLAKTPEGKYLAWEDDWDCDCCAPSEPDRCYLYAEISEEEANKLLKERE